MADVVSNKSKRASARKKRKQRAKLKAKQNRLDRIRTRPSPTGIQIPEKTRKMFAELPANMNFQNFSFEIYADIYDLIESSSDSKQ